MSGLSAENARIFRITHVDNVPWILRNGLYCRNSEVRDPAFRDIGNQELIARRASRIVDVEPGGTLSDYIAFYFTPYSPMLYNIKTGYNVPRVPMRDIAILYSTLILVQEEGIPFVFTDSHAYLRTANFYNDLTDLSEVDWALLSSRDFRRDDNDLGKFDRYQAEALIHQQLPVSALVSIVCYDDERKATITEDVGRTGVDVRVLSRPGWYF